MIDSVQGALYLDKYEDDVNYKTPLSNTKCMKALRTKRGTKAPNKKRNTDKKKWKWRHSIKIMAYNGKGTQYQGVYPPPY